MSGAAALASAPGFTERGFETVRLSFMVQRPANEARYRLVRAEGAGRTIRYTLERT